MGGKATIHQGNVGDPGDCERVIGEVIEQHGRLDILVNNAGLTVDRPILSMTVDDWHKVLRINLSGAFYMSKPALEHMIERGSGRIINISSLAGEIGNIGQANYAASKSGLFGFTKTLAREAAFALATAGKLTDDGIGLTVNAVTPGLIETDMTAAVPAKVIDAIQAAIPMRRMGRPDEIPGWWCSSPRTPRRTSPARSGASTAASTCDGCADTGSSAKSSHGTGAPPRRQALQKVSRRARTGGRSSPSSALRTHAGSARCGAGRRSAKRSPSSGAGIALARAASTTGHVAQRRRERQHFDSRAAEVGS